MNARLSADRPCVAVAYSGGRDSSALLHATLRAARDAGVQVLALHVHHGLQPQADAWLDHCERQCAAWRRRGWPVTFVSRRLDLRPGKGESIEAVARDARYAALREMALSHGANTVLLAHHRQDQAETFLLQALRGAGVAGLAGMPVAVERDGVAWVRPWLAQPRAAIEAYVRRYRLRYVDDDSNADARYARNRLRLQVWPALTQAFGQAEAALADAAAWAREAAACLDELAAQDLAVVATPQGLQLQPWQALGAARARNALRAWYRAQAGEPLPASWVDRLWDELPCVRTGQWPLPQGVLRSYRGVLRWQPAVAAAPAGAPMPETVLQVRRAGRYELPGWGGVLHVERCDGCGGVPLALLEALRLVPRQGGERFQAGAGRPPRSLKKQFQQAGVPGWARQGPLLYAGDALVFVPGLGLDARAVAMPGRSRVTLRWEPLAPA